MEWWLNHVGQMAQSVQDYSSILKLIYSRKQERAEQGKKLSSTDERYFKLAEYMLFSELSFVLNVPREHIEQYIADMIEA